MSKFSFLLSQVKKEKEILQNSLFIFLTGIISALLSTTLNIVFSRFFGPTGFGIFKTAIGLASTTAYFLDFGTKYFITRYIAEFKSRQETENINHLIKRTLLFKVIITLFILTVSWFFSRQIAQTFFHSQSQTGLVWPTMFLFTIIFLDITTPILLGYQHFKLLAITAILVPFSHIIVGLPLAYLIGIKGSLLGGGIAFIVGSIPAIKFIAKKISKSPKIKSFNFKNAFISYSLPAYFSSIPTSIGIVIIPLLSLFFTQRQVGLYSFSFSFYTAAQLIPITLSNVMFPKIAQLHSQKKSYQAFQTLKRLILIYTPLAVITGILIIPTAKPLIKLLVPSFLPATQLVIIQTIAALILGYFAIIVNYATAIHKFKTATLLNWTLSIIFLILAFYLAGLAK
ncbi:hypothetical protein A2697_02965 [Candidatus Curtissbacteria bacterium RIFCSPHIGHO2_01_FULL_41_44]|uniref:Polysaccharide biosynthesis protein C-terminal domain-containing protein n=1 Tax=Candidatus Curtissbacteria bacterium RIFCSPLOWO2_01_FULL_42_50 TaxID=1797730 RepID=A0A1F5H4Z1_9BACT|nr:MAG: hypothetical protein A3C33_00125 [Candidatus Curtissbacteria bacterium RIFCSPHIGHO2_02_FULL_42_58]OGD94174.1 MAG: hypothetical protein A2697_02965 [Candidatus Curtissbacteria bacterium RIFCSPHIGHO2_01_FULL_41_44]OGD97325.1 MAG: hypothetical protein A3E71_01840 [Candidatus Curtissbacteria bacterium RIFCSPHIGHO2_12_FULL_42_33]OGD99171.1 MAG: hypothetical protein A3B54_02605 [Candidatus Curtissbacteria bacterium RIFCSPLOWO2_01_FULL_42_50]OGE03577.1 MAG: hypothetical protein A3G16_00865 [Ca